MTSKLKTVFTSKLRTFCAVATELACFRLSAGLGFRLVEFKGLGVLDSNQGSRRAIGATTTTTAIGYEKNLPATNPEALIAREVAVPPLGPHDLLVEVEAVSVNPVDVKLRARAPAAGFRVLGFDAAGTVREVGSVVSLFTPGSVLPKTPPGRSWSSALQVGSGRPCWN